MSNFSVPQDIVIQTIGLYIQSTSNRKANIIQILPAVLQEAEKCDKSVSSQLLNSLLKGTPTQFIREVIDALLDHEGFFETCGQSDEARFLPYQLSLPRCDFRVRSGQDYRFKQDFQQQAVGFSRFRELPDLVRYIIIGFSLEIPNATIELDIDFVHCYDRAQFHQKFSRVLVKRDRGSQDAEYPILKFIEKLNTLLVNKEFYSVGAKAFFGNRISLVRRNGGVTWLDVGNFLYTKLGQLGPTHIRMLRLTVRQDQLVSYDSFQKLVSTVQENCEQLEKLELVVYGTGGPRGGVQFLVSVDSVTRYGLEGKELGKTVEASLASVWRLRCPGVELQNILTQPPIDKAGETRRN